METSPTIKNIADALFQFDAEVSRISKSATNPFFHNKYAPLPEILEAIKSPLFTAGLTVKQFPEGEHGMTTLIMHPLSGEWISSTYVMKPVKETPQEEGSRITYQRRYALGACLGLNIDEDDDGNKASETPKEAKEETKTDDRPWLNDKDFNAVITRIASGEYGEAVTVENFVKKVYDTYKVSKICRQKITEAVDFIKPK
jgi:hypothetical protein